MKRASLSLISMFMLVVLAMSVLSLSVLAEGTNGFTISPVREQFTVNPGQSKTVNVSVTNTSKIDSTVQAVINDFEANPDESGNPKLIVDSSESNNGNSFKSLVTTIPNFELADKQKKVIPVTISVPANAKAGGYYGTVRFVATDNPGDKNVALTASAGTIFLVTVPGNLTQSLALVEFTAAKNGSNGRFFINGGNMSVITRLKNTGNIHSQPFGVIQVKDSKGKIVQEMEFNNTDPRANILPESTRKFTNDLKNQKWFGKYSITANLAYGEGGGNLITAKNTFWVIPTWILIAAIAILVIIAIIIAMIVLKIMKSKKRRQKHIVS